MREDTDAKELLVLGWEVDPRLDPKYWLKPSAKVGLQSSSDLVAISPKAVANHTAIIAQSGSGKSFFLGRFIEELMLKTKSRCLIIDPNADFRKISQVADENIWSGANFDLAKRQGRLPDEATRKEFESRWAKVPTRVLTGMGVNDPNCEPLQILWTNLEIGFLAESADPVSRNALYHCHEFVKAIDDLLLLTGGWLHNKTDGAKEAEDLWNQHSGENDEQFRKVIDTEFTMDQYLSAKVGIDDLLTRQSSNVMSDPALRVGSRLLRLLADEEDVERRMPQAKDRAVSAKSYMNKDIARYYFGIVAEYRATKVVKMESRDWESQRHTRLEVVDLPTLPENVRLLAIDTLLGAEWKSARRAWQKAMRSPPELDTRVPTFIVVDEAHNLIPCEARTEAYRALRERFRTIAAEGRKYGLFLVVVSQRPDKLDSLILSECENRAVMRLGSESVLNITKKMLGLEDLPPKMLARTLEFELGRALIAGAWSGGDPQFLYSATRRTIEGGRNLWANHWAVVPDEISTLNATAH
jgi:Helicase HerA, central domain